MLASCAVDIALERSIRDNMTCFANRQSSMPHAVYTLPFERALHDTTTAFVHRRPSMTCADNAFSADPDLV